MDDGAAPGPWWKRVGWMMLIWVVSVALLGAVATVIRFWLRP